MTNPYLKEQMKTKEKIWTRDFLLICLANFFVFLGFQMTLPTIPLFVESLGGNERLIGLVVGIFTFSALIVRPFAGKALETKGRRLVFLFGLIVFVFTVGIFGFMTSIFLLFAMRIVQGARLGIFYNCFRNHCNRPYSSKRRGEGMGYYGLFGNIAIAIGPSLGLILADVLYSKQLFIICGLLRSRSWLLASTIRYKKVESSPKATSKKFGIYEKSAIQPAILVFFITVTFGGIATFLPLYTDSTRCVWYSVVFLHLCSFPYGTRIYAGQIYDQKGHQAIYIPSALLITVAMLLFAWMPSNTVLFHCSYFVRSWLWFCSASPTSLGSRKSSR